MKLTEWYPAEIKPVRAGLYQRDWEIQRLTELPDYFDGESWRYYEAERGPFGRQPNNRPWRGLAGQPE